MSQFVIKNIPNNRTGHEAARRLSAGQPYTRKRGRGPRLHDGRKYHNTLPISKAERFTLYIGPNTYPKVYASLDLFTTIERCKPHLILELSS